MVYFLRSADGSRIKIGTTMSMAQRLKQLVAEHGEGLEVLAVIDGSQPEEKALHRRFSHLRRVGEWFEPGNDLIGFIVSDGKPWDKDGERDDVTVKLDRLLASMARNVASKEGISVAQLLSEIVEKPLRLRHTKWMQQDEAEYNKKHKKSGESS
jgi:hypothetical protein